MNLSIANNIHRPQHR